MVNSNSPSIDTSELSLSRSVDYAFQKALELSSGSPLNSRHILYSALIMKMLRPTDAYRNLAYLLPIRDLENYSQGYSQAGSLDIIHINRFLYNSFLIAKPFFTENLLPVWGRDYITWALLSKNDPSLNQVAEEAGTTVATLQNEWFRFVTADQARREYESWAKWWKKAGVPIPEIKYDTVRYRYPHKIAALKPDLKTLSVAESITIGDSFLLTWNPDNTAIENFHELEREIQDQGQTTFPWSIGYRKNVVLGDRVFLARQDNEYPGLIGSGKIVSEVYQEPHWKKEEAAKGKQLNYVDVAWDTLQEFPLISLEELTRIFGEKAFWQRKLTGRLIPSEIANPLEKVWEQAKQQISMSKDSIGNRKKTISFLVSFVQETTFLLEKLNFEFFLQEEPKTESQAFKPFSGSLTNLLDWIYEGDVSDFETIDVIVCVLSKNYLNNDGKDDARFKNLAKAFAAARKGKEPAIYLLNTDPEIDASKFKCDGVVDYKGDIPSAARELWDRVFGQYNPPYRPREMEEYGTQNSALTDTASPEDLIWDGRYVRALADFIRNPDTEPPLVIGVNAPWGGGKSSLMSSLRKKLDGDIPEESKESPPPVATTMKMLWDRLRSKKTDVFDSANILPAADEKKPFATVWFNAWKYSKDEQVWAALVKSTITQVARRLPPLKREAFFLDLNLRRLDHDKIRMAIYQSVFTAVLPLAIAGVLSLVVAILALLINPWATLSGMVPFGIIANSIRKQIGSSMAKPLDTLKLGDYIKAPKYEEKIGFIGEMEADFKRVKELLEENGLQLVVFVDDLDRCAPGKIVEIIEAINVFFGSEHCQCIFVIGMDTQYIAKSIQCHYTSLVTELNDKDFGRHFLEKIVQVSMRIPQLSKDSLRDYLNKLFDSHDKTKIKLETELGPDWKIVEEEKEVIKEAEDLADVETLAEERKSKVTPSRKKEVEQAKKEVAKKLLTERDPIIREILLDAMSYLDQKPREVKRFLNRFRLASMLSIELGNDLNKENFERIAKWVALSLRFPEFIRKLKENETSIEMIEEKAASDKTWRELLGDLKWSVSDGNGKVETILCDQLRDLLIADPPLKDSKIDFATLI